MNDEAATAAALAGLPGIGPVRLRLLLAHHDPVDALDRLASGRPLDPMVTRTMRDGGLRQLRDEARVADVDAVRSACEACGAAVVVHGSDEYPPQLVHDPEAPAVLFVRGDPAVLDGRRVGVVGTRNATSSGLATARELGSELAAHGVAVVSGLARGIDGAAHAGVRDAGGPGAPVGVAGSGIDRPYPRRHAGLWSWVAGAGVLLSEWPPGVEPSGWRFPQRNRIIAALAEVLVVVESRERGGSLITARLAADRGVEVMAVPGSPRSPASVGANRLLLDGAAPVTAVADVLAMLGIDHRRAGCVAYDPRPRPDPVQARVVDACRAGPCTLDAIVDATGLSLTDAALAAARLERAGWLVEAGGWFEQAGSRLADR